jgi:hypothetical protein
LGFTILREGRSKNRVTKVLDNNIQNGGEYQINDGIKDDGEW